MLQNIGDCGLNFLNLTPLIQNPASATDHHLHTLITNTKLLVLIFIVYIFTLSCSGSAGSACPVGFKGS